MNQQNLLSLLKSTGGFISISLPIIQFAYKWLPDKLSSLFLNSELIFFTTLITFLTSVFFIFIGISRFTIIIPTLQKKTDPENNEKYRVKKFLQFRTIAIWLILIVFISAISFMLIGASKTEIYWLMVIQAATYILTISLSVFILVVFSYDVADRKKREEIERDRPRKAINLAKEIDAIKEIPRIHFLYGKDELNTQRYIVEVRVKDQKYKIITDKNAEVLWGVTELENK